MQYATKRIYEPADQEDGCRVLVDRLWPRGIKREDATIDLWAKELAPSHDLRKWFAHVPKRFAEFAGRYRQELNSRQDVAMATYSAAEGKKRITLLYAAKDTQHNHAVVLKEWLEKVEGETHG